MWCYGESVFCWLIHEIIYPLVLHWLWETIIFLLLTQAEVFDLQSFLKSNFMLMMMLMWRNKQTCVASLLRIFYHKTHLVIAYLERSNFPSRGKVVTPIAKINNFTEYEYLSTISPLCIISKILKKAAHHQLYGYHLSNAMFLIHQSGFRRTIISMFLLSENVFDG